MTRWERARLSKQSTEMLLANVRSLRMRIWETCSTPEHFAATKLARASYEAELTIIGRMIAARVRKGIA